MAPPSSCVRGVGGSGDTLIMREGGGGQYRHQSSRMRGEGGSTLITLTLPGTGSLLKMTSRARAAASGRCCSTSLLAMLDMWHHQVRAGGLAGHRANGAEGCSIRAAEERNTDWQ